MMSSRLCWSSPDTAFLAPPFGLGSLNSEFLVSGVLFSSPAVSAATAGCTCCTSIANLKGCAVDPSKTRRSNDSWVVNLEASSRFLTLSSFISRSCAMTPEGAAVLRAVRKWLHLSACMPRCVSSCPRSSMLVLDGMGCINISSAPRISGVSACALLRRTAARFLPAGWCLTCAFCSSCGACSSLPNYRFNSSSKLPRARRAHVSEMKVSEK